MEVTKAEELAKQVKPGTMSIMYVCNVYALWPYRLGYLEEITWVEVPRRSNIDDRDLWVHLQILGGVNHPQHN